VETIQSLRIGVIVTFLNHDGVRVELAVCDGRILDEDRVIVDADALLLFGLEHHGLVLSLLFGLLLLLGLLFRTGCLFFRLFVSVLRIVVDVVDYSEGVVR
jgi:uncharacterized membrane protein YphA (DoxX/SURF4 family)